MSARKQDSKNLKINKKSNRDFIKAIKSEKESVAIKDVRTCLVSENIPFLPQTYKIHLFENDSIKKQTNVNELESTDKVIEKKTFLRIPTPSQASEEIKILKNCWENILSSEDVLSATLEDPSSQLLPQRDDKENLHGAPISYHIAKVIFKRIHF